MEEQKKLVLPLVRDELIKQKTQVSNSITDINKRIEVDYPKAKKQQEEYISSLEKRVKDDQASLERRQQHLPELVEDALNTLNTSKQKLKKAQDELMNEYAGMLEMLILFKKKLYIQLDEINKHLEA